MYSYRFELVPANKKSSISYKDYESDILNSCDKVNKGVSFERENKSIKIESVDEKSITVVLSCTQPLNNSSRCLSALSRELLKTDHKDAFSESAYNKSLFVIKLCKDNDENDFTDIDLLHTITDILFGYTSKNKADEEQRQKTIKEIKALAQPYRR